MDHRNQNKMLIDATHPEETRVVVIRNGRVEEFDFESASKKPLRGNIYLAKVTRVEPSLQAAFVEYGGNRHGFLPFNEIHPDYYQIPLADRQALLDEEMAEHEAEREADERAERGQRGGRGGRRDRGGERPGADGVQADNGEGEPHDPSSSEPVAFDASTGGVDTTPTLTSADVGTDATVQADAAPAATDTASTEPARTDEPPRPPRELAEATGLAPDAVRTESAPDERAPEERASSERPADPYSATADREAAPDDLGHPADHIEEIPVTADEPEIITGAGAEADNGDALEEVQERPRRQRRRQYKIQEVIKRRQIMLVQVVKEERGTKGAALTTYLSLAGRYTVLMPNTASGGGISRKITQPQDRKRLKEIARELDVPEGMGLIIRTAGAARSTQEIRRDYEYELRLWESIREVTLASTAPSLVYEEGDLIKRSIRDLYSKDIDEIVVAGEVAHREAQDFMRMLMPSHVKNVILHDSPQPLFARYPAVDRQMNAMFSPHVPLKSGGYLVINQTEALVAIDINSGKSTREFNIEDTATNTNLEAADEIARQLRLRDLAGLIVIDFIDMEEKRNIRNVERRMKDALRHDRARIQVGRISHFGLLEMSRQRMRTGVLEGSTTKCPHCEGTGIIRSVESICLAVLRGLEDHLQRDSRTSVTVHTNADVAIYILNHKRAYLSDIEQRFGVAVHVVASEKLLGANFQIERSAAPPPARRQPQRAPVNMNSGFDGSVPEMDEADLAAPADDEDPDDQPLVAERDARTAPSARHEPRGEGRGDERQMESGSDGKRRRRRRRGRRGRDEDQRGTPPPAAGAESDPRDGEAVDRFDEETDDQPTVTADAFPTSGQRPAADDVPGDDDQPELINGDGEDQPSLTPPSGEIDDRRRRRRGRRGGRQRRERDETGRIEADGRLPAAEEVATIEIVAAPPVLRDSPTPAADTPAAPMAMAERAIEPSPATAVASVPVTAEPHSAPVVAVEPLPPKPEPLLAPLVVSDAPARPAKSGWWRRG